MEDATPQSIQSYLLALVEDHLKVLEKNGCCVVEDDFFVGPLPAVNLHYLLLFFFFTFLLSFDISILSMHYYSFLLLLLCNKFNLIQ